jgi:hypothetical protein
VLGDRQKPEAGLLTVVAMPCLAGDYKTNWRASAHHFPVDTWDSSIFEVIQLEITVHISNADYPGGLSSLRLETYRDDASSIRSVYWRIGCF